MTPMRSEVQRREHHHCHPAMRRCEFGGHQAERSSGQERRPRLRGGSPITTSFLDG